MRKIAFLILLIAFGLFFTGCEVSPDAKFRVNYYGNGETSGYPHPDFNEYKYGDQALILNENTLLRTGFTFRGWNTRPDGSGDSHEVGDKIIIRGPVFLYAKWIGESM